MLVSTPRVTRMVITMVTSIALVAFGGCSRKGASTQEAKVRAFATDYTAAWCSQHASRVADHFAQNGSLKINDGAASVGRAAITQAAEGFMTAFPDMVVAMDSLRVNGNHAVYHWTLTGTNTGPNGTGKAVRISGFEEWTLGPDGLILQSLGHFDEAEYKQQLEHGVT